MFLVKGKADLYLAGYFGAYADHRRIHGMWFDYVITILVYLYFNLCNFWLLFRPVKIVFSETTKQNLLRIAEIDKTSEDEFEDMTEGEIIKETANKLKMQFGASKTLKASSEWIFVNFHLLMIAFILAVSILNQSLLSFGYFVFCMVLIQDNKNFFD